MLKAVFFFSLKFCIMPKSLLEFETLLMMNIYPSIPEDTSSLGNRFQETQCIQRQHIPSDTYKIQLLYVMYVRVSHAYISYRLTPFKLNTWILELLIFINIIYYFQIQCFRLKYLKLYVILIYLFIQSFNTGFFRKDNHLYIFHLFYISFFLFYFII